MSHEVSRRRFLELGAGGLAAALAAGVSPRAFAQQHQLTIGLLRAPRQYAEIARVGRIGEEARAVDDLIADRRRTGIVLVTLAEEMPVNETIDALGRLRELGLDAECAIVNGLADERFSDVEEAAIGRLRSLGGTGAAAVEAALSQITRRREQRAELARLREGIDIPLVELPLLAVPALEPDALAGLAEQLAAELEPVR